MRLHVFWLSARAAGTWSQTGRLLDPLLRAGSAESFSYTSFSPYDYNLVLVQYNAKNYGLAFQQVCKQKLTSLYKVPLITKIIFKKKTRLEKLQTTCLQNILQNYSNPKQQSQQYGTGVKTEQILEAGLGMLKT